MALLSPPAPFPASGVQRKVMIGGVKKEKRLLSLVRGKESRPFSTVTKVRKRENTFFSCSDL